MLCILNITKEFIHIDNLCQPSDYFWQYWHFFKHLTIDIKVIFFSEGFWSLPESRIRTLSRFKKKITFFWKTATTISKSKKQVAWIFRSLRDRGCAANRQGDAYRGLISCRVRLKQLRDCLG